MLSIKKSKRWKTTSNSEGPPNEAETREARLAAGDLAGAKALRNIIIAEETQEMWRQIRSMFGTRSGKTNVAC
jgi:hypothetical protein